MEIKDRMRSVGLKATPQRRLVYEVMLQLAHASIEEIIESVQSIDSDITISTIYRVLNSFSDSNLLSKINHPNGKTYYDINITEHHHIITDEQKLIDIDDPELSEIIKQRLLGKLEEGMLIDKISIHVTTVKK